MKTFLVNKGTLAQLDWIPFGERDRLIEEFLLHSYTGPTKPPVELKRRSGEKEQIAVNLSETALSKLESYAAAVGDKVKRSHIFKDMMEQFMQTIPHEKNKALLALKKRVFLNLHELNKYMSKAEIQEEMTAYIAAKLEE